MAETERRVCSEWTSMKRTGMTMTGVTQRQLRSMPVGLRISLNDKIETQKYCEEEKHENNEKKLHGC